MKKSRLVATPASCAVEVFQPHPDTLYSLDAAAHLAGVSRRAVLICCRAGLVQPVSLPPYGAMAFTEVAICSVRRIERMRSVLGCHVLWLKTMFDLLAELERLRAEVRFLRNR